MFWSKKSQDKLPSNWNFKTNGFINKKILFTLFWFLVLSMIAAIVLAENFIPSTLTQNGKAIASATWSDWNSIQNLITSLVPDATGVTSANIIFWNANMPDLFFNFDERQGLNITFVVFLIIALVLPFLGIVRLYFKYKKQAKLNLNVELESDKLAKTNYGLITTSIIISIISLVIFFVLNLSLVFALQNLRQVPDPLNVTNGSFNEWKDYVEAIVVDKTTNIATINLKPTFSYVAINDTIKYAMLSSTFFSIMPLALISFTAIFIEWHVRKSEKLLAIEASNQDLEIISEVEAETEIVQEMKNEALTEIKEEVKTKKTSTSSSKTKKKTIKK